MASPSTADLYDEHGDDLQSCSVQFRHYGAQSSFEGVITTIRCHRDNAIVKSTLTEDGSGRVLVVDGGASLESALMGDLIAASAVANGWEGVVIHGAVRDVAYIRSRSLPVFAAGITHRGPYKDGPGEINVPVAIEGMVIHPGDLVLGDDDGVLCVPFDDCDEVYVAAKAKYDAEQRSMQAILAGTDDRTWVDATLRKLNCEIQS